MTKKYEDIWKEVLENKDNEDIVQMKYKNTKELRNAIADTHDMQLHFSAKKLYDAMCHLSDDYLWRLYCALWDFIDNWLGR